MSSEYWADRVETEGRMSVVNLTGIALKDEDFDRLTNAQAINLFTTMKLYIKDTDRHALDYGCGWARFSDQLSSLVYGDTDAFDPCQEMLNLATAEKVSFINNHSHLISESYDVILVAWVLQDVDNPDEVIEHISSLLAPGGMLCVVDTMRVRYEGGGRFTHLRHFSHYVEKFAAYGITLDIAGEIPLFGNPCPLLLGRKA